VSLALGRHLPVNAVGVRGAITPTEVSLFRGKQRLAKTPDSRRGTPEQMQAHGALATKLLRTFTSQTEALAKIKRGGEQTVRVEHVHGLSRRPGDRWCGVEQAYGGRGSR